jgi:DNA-binding MltR family transcriptional regulator
MSLARVPTAQDVIANWQGLFDGLAHRNHAVCIIVGAAYVDHSLGALLREHFVNSNISHDGLLHPIKGTIGEISKRAKVAYSLGLISEGCFEAVRKIADIRNAIAHSTDILTFKNAHIIKLCGELKIPKKGPAFATFPPLRRVTKRGMKSPRGKFVFMAIAICTHIILKANNTPKCQKVTDYWDDV